ncbi:MAG: penicillin-binding transpeptidase domain-containing protein [Chitinophagaceae bacterium]
MRLLNKIAFSLFAFAIVMVGCSPNNVTKDAMPAKYFDSLQLKGCFALNDNGTGEFTIYNLERYRDSSFLPASTFKIVNALVAIETGRVLNETTVFPWSGKWYTTDNGDTMHAWCKDLTFKDAFAVSAVPVYQQVARSIGKDTMQLWLDSLSYGTKKIVGAVDSFWLNNSLTIKPDEQLGLVKKLYFGQLPFQKRTQDIVKKMMIREQNSQYTLAFKTGLGNTPAGKQLAWIIGWIEENKHVYFFVLNAEADKAVDMVSARETVFRKIMTEYGFFQGKK